MSFDFGMVNKKSFHTFRPVMYKLISSKGDTLELLSPYNYGFKAGDEIMGVAYTHMKGKQKEIFTIPNIIYAVFEIEPTMTNAFIVADGLLINNLTGLQKEYEQAKEKYSDYKW